MAKKQKLLEKRNLTTQTLKEDDRVYDEINSLSFKKCFENLMSNYKTRKSTKSDK